MHKAIRECLFSFCIYFLASIPFSIVFSIIMATPWFGMYLSQYVSDNADNTARNVTNCTILNNLTASCSCNCRSCLCMSCSVMANVIYNETYNKTTINSITSTDADSSIGNTNDAITWFINKFGFEHECYYKRDNVLDVTLQLIPTSYEYGVAIAMGCFILGICLCSSVIICCALIVYFNRKRNTIAIRQTYYDANHNNEMQQPTLIQQTPNVIPQADITIIPQEGINIIPQTPRDDLDRPAQQTIILLPTPEDDSYRAVVRGYTLTMPSTSFEYRPTHDDDAFSESHT